MELSCAKQRQVDNRGLGRDKVSYRSQQMSVEFDPKRGLQLDNLIDLYPLIEFPQI